jgi:hypothetical protein
MDSARYNTEVTNWPLPAVFRKICCFGFRQMNKSLCVRTKGTVHLASKKMVPRICSDLLTTIDVNTEHKNKWNYITC